MMLSDFFLPSWEKLLLFFLVAMAANFPFIGSYHTDQTNVLCIQEKALNCDTAYLRQMHLNPIFWFPYILEGGSDIIANTTGGNDDLRIPLVELSKNLRPAGFFLTLIFWYLAASVMVAPFSVDKKD
ncbi:MAG: hypothetical protein ABIG96_01505 [Candidatus Micrarchaeota archaeon]